MALDIKILDQNVQEFVQEYDYENAQTLRTISS